MLVVVGRQGVKANDVEVLLCSFHYLCLGVGVGGSKAVGSEGTADNA